MTDVRTTLTFRGRRWTWVCCAGCPDMEGHTYDRAPVCRARALRHLERTGHPVEVQRVEHTHTLIERNDT